MVQMGREIRSGAFCALWQLRNQQPTSLEAAEIGVFGASSVGSLFPSAGSFNLSVSRMCCLPGGVWRGRQGTPPPQAPQQPPAQAPAPQVQFSAEPQTISPGQNATLHWSTTNATTISIDQGVGSNL